MKVNKYLLIFIGLFLILSIAVSFLLYKFFPLLIHHTIYYCQEMIYSFSLQMPTGFGLFIFAIILITLLVTIVKLVSLFLHMHRFRRSLHKSVSFSPLLRSLLKEMSLVNKVAMTPSEKPFAFCFGIKSPKIYISTKLVSLVTKSELKTILLHEKYHLEHHDALTLLIAHIAASLFPFIPLLSDLIDSYRTEREIMADKAAIKENAHRHLVSIFKKLLLYEPNHYVSVLPAIADPHTLDARIKSLVHNKEYQHIIVLKNIFISLFSLCVIALFIVAPVHAIELHESGQDVMILCSSRFPSHPNAFLLPGNHSFIR
ncbi:hypothetical protein COY90_02175 [Candidatus Roizmanbacteria bacterium CG_4_10_14_0_8_um_filter_39_9]|uniref:Peptidase M56 domain-containing protein n=1 Tax=Candidatus Roizmanbacteria bacterium CG_4_10_14_0_8_um_filter_39_9 TaxID=1974829 RepID=A0A2M7QE04_9BACT|nr:MAG: hypothetical protein COY90_02175 [Candidatus Roizmanbacteria bacterium CG_4_10_14_0_8_um_filter_39_9]